MNLRLVLIWGVLQVVAIISEAQVNLSLSEALKIAKEKSLMLQSQKFDIQAAQAEITTAKLRYNPILNNQSLQLMSNMHFAQNTPFYSNRNRQVWWQLTQKFYVKGQRLNKIEFAQHGFELAEKDYSDKERLYLQDVSDQWLLVWSLSVNLDLTIEARKNIDTLVYINLNRLKNQVINSTEATRTLILAKQYDLQTRVLRRQYLNELMNLKLLLGVQDSLQIDIHKDDSLFVKNLPLFDTLIAQALEQRTDVQYAKTLIKTSESNEKLQKSMAYPQPDAGFIWNPQNSIPYLGVYATVPLPVNDRNQGQIQKSKVLTRQAQTSLDFTEQQVFTELTNAYNNYKTQKESLVGYDEILKQAEDVLAKVRYSYLRGNTTFVDFLEAQRSLFETRKLYYESLFQFRQSYVRVLFSSGLNNLLEQ